MEIYNRIETLMDQGIDITPFIEMLDDIDCDPDLECSEDECDFDIEGEYLHLSEWQNYSLNAPVECLLFGNIHICKVE